jgi:hypothetical protein
MAKRYSGRAVVTVTYQDRGDYKCSVSIGKRAVWSGRISAPKSGFGRGVAYDSPAAYDHTAETALSFAEDETHIVGDAAEYAPGGDGWHVGRSLATRHGKQANPAKRKAITKAPTYFYSMYREVITPESAEHGDADHTDEIAVDEGPFRRLEDLLDAAGARSESWDWSSSHPSTGYEWLSTQDGDMDWRTGETSTLSLHISRARRGPLSMKDIERISDALDVRLRTRKASKTPKTAPRRKKSPRRRPW